MVIGLLIGMHNLSYAQFGNIAIPQPTVTEKSTPSSPSCAAFGLVKGNYLVLNPGQAQQQRYGQAPPMNSGYCVAANVMTVTVSWGFGNNPVVTYSRCSPSDFVAPVVGDFMCARYIPDHDQNDMDLQNLGKKIDSLQSTLDQMQKN